MSTMIAAVLRERGGVVASAEVPVPRPGPGEVLVRVAAAGVCHSDLSLRDGAPGMPALPRYPWVLGHEVAGTVVAGGELEPGTAVAVWPGWGDGTCALCRSGREQYCAARRHAGSGSPGGWAEYLLVPAARHLVPTGDLDPAGAAVCTDAGLTSYSAVAKVAPLLRDGGTAVVIGVGGVGRWAVAHLRRTPATVVALDPLPGRRAASGAHHAFEPDEEGAVRDLTPAGLGATAVLDVVGTAETLALAARLVAPGGRIVLVGMGGGTLPVGFGALPAEAVIGTSGLGSVAELAEVLRLTAAEGCPLDLDRRPLSTADAALADLAAGRVAGRAVLIP
jgi:alcohol dehydrogenase, propanol-preferring